MPYRASKNCSELLDMTQTCPTKMLKIARNDPSWPEKKIKIAQNLKMSQNVLKCLTMGQQVSKGVVFLHIQVRKLSSPGIAVAGVYCCMGLRSVSIEPRSCLLLRSEPSIVSFNWQGSLVIRLVAIVQINDLSRKKRIALIGKTVHARSFFCFITASWWYHSETWTSRTFSVILLDLKGSGSKPNGSTPQIANSEFMFFIRGNVEPFCFVVLVVPHEGGRVRQHPQGTVEQRRNWSTHKTYIDVTNAVVPPLRTSPMAGETWMHHLF